MLSNYFKKKASNKVAAKLLSHFSHVRLCVTPQTAAHQAPPSWDSPGKNTGVGCHFLLQCMKVKSESEVAQSCPTLRDPMDCSLSGSPIHGIFQARVWSGVPLPSPVRLQSIKSPPFSGLADLQFIKVTFIFFI